MSLTNWKRPGTVRNILRWMLPRMLSLGLLFGFVVSNANADLISYWNFNSYAADYIGPADTGTRPGDYEVDAEWTQLAVGTGTAINRENNTFAPGNAIALLEPDSDGNTGRTMTLSVDLTGYENLVVSHAERRNANGFQINDIQYSTDGVNFTDFATYNPTLSYEAYEFDMSSVTALNDNANVFIRYKFDAALHQDGKIGRNVIDNIRFSADASGGAAVPEPGTFVATGSLLLMGLGYMRRRRKNQPETEEENSETAEV